MIKKLAMVSLAAFIGIISWTGLHAVGTKEEAKALVAKAIVYFRANGKERAFSEISNPGGIFVKGDLYIIVYDMNGVCVANGFNARLINKNMRDIEDSEGKLYVKNFIDITRAKGNGWLNYKFANASTYRIEKKTAYVEKAANFIFACSAYD